VKDKAWCVRSASPLTSIVHMLKIGMHRLDESWNARWPSPFKVGHPNRRRQSAASSEDTRAPAGRTACCDASAAVMPWVCPSGSFVSKFETLRLMIESSRRIVGDLPRMRRRMIGVRGVEAR
jgi:hypothetical protein